MVVGGRCHFVNIRSRLWHEREGAGPKSVRGLKGKRRNCNIKGDILGLYTDSEILDGIELCRYGRGCDNVMMSRW